MKRNAGNKKSDPTEDYPKLSDAEYRLARAYRLIEQIASRVRAEEENRKKASGDANQVPLVENDSSEGEVTTEKPSTDTEPDVNSEEPEDTS